MRKRSKYRPKEVLTDPVSWVISGMKPLSTVSDVMNRLRTKNHLAMRRVVMGEADAHDVDLLVEAFNITEGLTRVKADLGRDWSEEIEQGHLALKALAERGVRTGRFVFTGAELAAANLVMEIHDVQLSKCTVAQMELAIHEVAREIRGQMAKHRIEVPDACAK